MGPANAPATPQPYGAAPAYPAYAYPYAQAPTPHYPGNAPPAYSYPYYGYYMPGYVYAQPPRRAPGETYRTVLAWIVTIGGGLTILGGLLLLGLTALSGARGTIEGLAALGQLVGLIVAAIAGGAAGLYFGITALMRRPSVRFGLPSVWIFLGLAAVAIGGEVALWNLFPTPGALVAILPLFVLAGALPAGAILAYTARRLNYPSTWRHVALSLAFGATVAPVLASILEVLAFLLVVLLLRAFGLQIQFDLNFLQNVNPTGPNEILMFFLVGSVIAPLVEEGLKPLGAVLLLPRVRGPGEAFLIGLAAGQGFAVVETLGYFGMGQADWINIAIERLGVGLLHGVGAGMAAMGWYYLIRGKGVSRRWLLGFGALAYAVVQHGVFNASNLLGAIPPIGQWLNSPTPLITLGTLPIDRSALVALSLYLL
ncbi:MAG TPA: PrsW family glutamic-type intramembrane protease, partial [Ktedonobacterales bacterium]